MQTNHLHSHVYDPGFEGKLLLSLMLAVIALWVLAGVFVWYSVYQPLMDAGAHRLHQALNCLTLARGGH